MRRWHTIPAFFLLLILAAPLVFLSFLQVKQAYIKHGAEERLERGLLKTLFVPQQSWQALNDHEIVVDGKLFDVKDVCRTADGFTVTGVFDEEETNVLQQIDRSGNVNASKDTPAFAQFFQLLQGLFIHDASAQPFVAVAAIQLFQKPIPSLTPVYQQIVSPPPQSNA